MPATHASNVVPMPTPVDLHTIKAGERFSTLAMPFAVFALLTVEGMPAHDGNDRWAVVIDMADEAKDLLHGQLVKLHRNDRVRRVAQVQLATYCLVAR